MLTRVMYKSIYKSHFPVGFFPAILFPRHAPKFLIDKDASIAPKYCDHGFSESDPNQEQ